MAETFLGVSGYWWAIISAAFAVVLGGLASSVGIRMAASAAAGVLSEDDSKFGQLLPLVAMPGTQGVYGFITAVLIAVFFNILGGNTEIPALIGFSIFLAVQPVSWLCLITALYQARASVLAIQVVGAGKKAPSLVFPALVETYAILSLIVSILLLLGISASIG